MSALVLAAMAVRVQETMDRLAALKARTPAEVKAEAQLRSRLAEVFAPLLDGLADGVTSRGGIPTDPGLARGLLGDLVEVQEQLVTVLAEEVGEEAARAIEAVERKVAAKQLDRPLGMDAKLFETVTRLGDKMLERFTGRTLDALVAAAGTDLSSDELRATLAEMLDGELRQLSRHAVGDTRNEATEVAERELGVQFHMWVTAGDSDVRPAHDDVDGEVVAVGEPFSNGWRRPGGVGCRCRLEPWFPPYPPVSDWIYDEDTDLWYASQADVGDTVLGVSSDPKSFEESATLRDVPKLENQVAAWERLENKSDWTGDPIGELRGELRDKTALAQIIRQLRKG